jgi:magnesium transporter
MLYAFNLSNGRLNRLQIEEGSDLRAMQPVWLDLIAPTDEDRARVEEAFGVRLPRPAHLQDIEASARFYEGEGEVHLRSDFLSGKESRSRSVTVAFVLSGSTLISVHEDDLPIFRLLRMHLHAQAGNIEDNLDVLVDLYGMDVEFSADALEKVYADLGEVSRRVLSGPLRDRDAAKALAVIAHAEHINGRIRRNVMDTQRAVSFLIRSRLLRPEQVEEARLIQQDIESLHGHTAFLSDKINFLMNSTTGFININQNRIVRMFTIASVVLLPPTLVASVYGMNFEFMPELGWKLGYPFALTLMALSVAGPLWFFLRKGWLK